jgi:hypothetical protein
LQKSSQVGRRWSVSVTRYQIGSETLLFTGVAASDDYAGLNSRMTIESGFNLAWFNSITQNLDLFIDAPQVSKLAIVKTPRKVAGLVESRTALSAKWIGNESFGSQIGTISITASYANSADAKFSGFTRRNLLEVFVEQINLGIRDGSTNRGQTVMFRSALDSAGGCDNRALSRSVVVY